MSKKSFFIVPLLLIASIVLAACSSQTTPSTTTPATTDTKPAQQKVGDTTKTGRVSKVGDKFFLTVAGGQPEEIDSYALDLDQYVGQELSVTGQYSGDTLFVGKIE